ncbi:MAG: hypothetical protein WD871_12160 [Xanthobacteraceae bacterium]
MTGWTLGKVKASFFDLEAHCENESCRHFYVFDLDPLIEGVGADFAVENIPPLTCQNCGGSLKVWLAAPDPREQEEDDPAET